MPTQHRTRKAADASRFAIFPVVVSRVQKISDHYTRISLTGASLTALSDTAGDSTQNLYDAYIKLFVPPPGSTTHTDIELTDDWRSQWFCRPEHERGWMRTYTVRARRMIPASAVPAIDSTLETALPISPRLERELVESNEVPEIDIDFVIHRDASGAMGPGATWADNAQVGDLVSFLGPLRGDEEHFSPLWTTWAGRDAQRLIIAVDETAVPAACSILTSLSPDQSADLLLEVPGEGDVLNNTQALLEPELAELPNVRVHWLPRGCNGSSTVRGEELYRKLRELLDIAPIVEYRVLEEDSDDSAVWDISAGDGDYYVFIAGESSVIKTLRRICVNDAGMDKANVSFMGYWKKGRSES